MHEVMLKEAEVRLTELIDEAACGEEFVITRELRLNPPPCPAGEIRVMPRKEPAPMPERTASRLPIACIALGVCGLLSGLAMMTAYVAVGVCAVLFGSVTAIAAVVCGHIAWSRMGKSGTPEGVDAIAIGLTLGYLSVVVSAWAAASLLLRLYAPLAPSGYPIF